MGSRGPGFVLNNKNNYGTPGQHFGDMGSGIPGFRICFKNRNNYGTPGQHFGAWARGFRGPGFVLNNKNNYGTPGQHFGAWARVGSEGRGSVFLGSRPGSVVCVMCCFNVKPCL